MKKNLKKGFTLTELVVVIVIIGILASVLIPTLTSYITRSRKSAAEQEANARLQEVAAYILDNDNENWFVWNEFVKGSTIAVESAHGYYVYFVKGELKQNLTATKTSAPTDVTVLSMDGTSYKVTVLEADKVYFNGTKGQLYKTAAHLTDDKYVAQAYFEVSTAGAITYAA